MDTVAPAPKPITPTRSVLYAIFGLALGFGWAIIVSALLTLTIFYFFIGSFSDSNTVTFLIVPALVAIASFFIGKKFLTKMSSPFSSGFIAGSLLVVFWPLCLFFIGTMLGFLSALFVHGQNY